MLKPFVFIAIHGPAGDPLLFRGNVIALDQFQSIANLIDMIGLQTLFDIFAKSCRRRTRPGKGNGAACIDPNTVLIIRANGIDQLR